MTDIFLALVIDVAVLAVCVCVLHYRGALRDPLHSAALFVMCHCVVVTQRLVALNLQFVPANWLAWPVTVDEVIRAARGAELLLSSMVTFWAVSAWHRDRRTSSLAVSACGTAPFERTTQWTAAICLLLGLIALASGAREANATYDARDSFGATEYVLGATKWPAWAFAMLIFVKGFKPVYVVGFLTSLVLVLATSVSRYGVILPTIYVGLATISRDPARRFRLRLVIAAVLLWFLWFPLKQVQSQLKEVGVSSIGALLATAGESIQMGMSTDANVGSGSVDSQYLDLEGAYMTLADVYGKPFYGSTILPLFALPIPRNIWPEKPHLDEYLRQISTPSRPLGNIQMVPGLVGEGYADFRYPGIVAMGVGIAWLYGSVYKRATRAGHLTAGRMFYLLLLTSAIQVYRDGLYSLLLFPLDVGMPITLAALAVWFKETLFPVNSMGKAVIRRVRLEEV